MRFKKLTIELLVCMFVFTLIVSSCGGTADQTTVPDQWIPAGSYVIQKSDGWDDITSALGMADVYLINGVEVKYKDTYTLTPGNLVALAVKPDKSSSPYIGAPAVEFKDGPGTLEYKMYAFDPTNPISPVRLKDVLQDGCDDINSTLGFGHDSKMYGLKDGCNFYVAVVYSLEDGTTGSFMASGFIDALDKVNALDMGKVKMLTFLVFPITIDQPVPGMPEIEYR